MSKQTTKSIKRAALQTWLDKADSGILNKNCEVTIEALDSLNLKQLNAVLKVISASFSQGYRSGSQGMRELLLKKYRTHHTLMVDSHNGNVSIYDDNGDFVDKVNNLDEADAIVNKRNSLRKLNLSI